MAKHLMIPTRFGPGLSPVSTLPRSGRQINDDRRAVPVPDGHLRYAARWRFEVPRRGPVLRLVGRRPVDRRVGHLWHRSRAIRRGRPRAGQRTLRQWDLRQWDHRQMDRRHTGGNPLPRDDAGRDRAKLRRVRHASGDNRPSIPIHRRRTPAAMSRHRHTRSGSPRYRRSLGRHNPLPRMTPDNRAVRSRRGCPAAARSSRSRAAAEPRGRNDDTPITSSSNYQQSGAGHKDRSWRYQGELRAFPGWRPTSQQPTDDIARPSTMIGVSRSPRAAHVRTAVTPGTR
jgi:hypothetical protein